MDEKPIAVETVDALIAWLEEVGVDLALWGENGAKTAVSLHRELQEQDCKLFDNPPRRVVRVVELIIRREGLQLMEVAQEMADGHLRHRTLPPSEKMKQGETVIAGAIRCMEEELNVSHPITSDPSTHRTKARVLESPSYPGLITQYSIHTVETVIDDLPDDDFWCDNAAFTDGDPVRRHQWGWRTVA